MRFVLISTHVDQTTGYSKVVYNLIGQLDTLAPDVRTYHFGFQRHGAFYDIARIYNTELDRNGLGSREDLKKRLLLVDTSAKAINDSSINEIYNIADIGINTSDGEGFGLCQIEHLYTGAPQIVTDIGTYRDFMDDSVCEFIESRSYSYFSGTMPLGQISPQFSVPDITSAMQRLIARLSTAKEAAAAFKFKTWDEVCAGWIADIKSEIGSK